MNVKILMKEKYLIKLLSKKADSKVIKKSVNKGKRREYMRDSINTRLLDHSNRFIVTLVEVTDRQSFQTEKIRNKDRKQKDRV